MASCMTCMTKRAKLMVVLGVLGLLCVITGCVFLGVADNIIHSKISSRMPLTDKGQTYDQWRHSKSPLYFQVWAFDTLNPEAVLKGDKPEIKEKGPYTYWDERSKHDINFSDDGTVYYKEKRKYNFERSLSVGSDSDTVTVPNLAMTSVMSVLRDKDNMTKAVVEQIFKKFNQTLFVEMSVHDLIWGYKDILLEALAPLAKSMNITLPENNTIGLFTNHNDTDSDNFVIYSGQKGLANFAEIISWNGQKALKLWTSDYANALNGSLGTLFPPFVKKEDQHFFFSTDLTRTLSLKYHKEVEVHGVPLYKFVTPPDNFANVTINPDNAGFCTPAGHCLPSGLLNISNSHYGAPVVASNPHFLFCDKDIRKSVTGLSPNQEAHQSHINLEPLTGVNMDFAIRVQINVHLEKIQGFHETEKLVSVFMPTAWISENAKITKHQAKDFKHQVLDLIIALHVIKYGFLALGCLLLLIAACIPIVYKLRKSSKSEKEENIQKGKPARRRKDSSDSEVDPLLSSCMDSD
ncbi:scavenger receptor class B member 1 [Elysia marginata]|uniref:Scavenger receptor class B member 1 n=1 Tax=Elysia marginata TaxID=1093978 RepID=A0AAV4J1Q2_9GAST|nr:scavenger receptor class B member 1 [Elysia marginata]